MTTDVVLQGIWITLVVLMLVGAVLMKWFYKRLEEQHREEWERMGSPTLILNNSMANQSKVGRFLRRGEYRLLEDPTLTRLALAAKVLGSISMFLFLLGAALVVAD